MDQNEKYDAIIADIYHVALVLAEMWEAVRTLFMNYAEYVITALTPITETFSNPFGIEGPCPSQEAMESRIMTVEDARRHSKAPLKRYGIKVFRRPQRAQIHYNYIPRVARNQPYQRRVY